MMEMMVMMVVVLSPSPLASLEQNFVATSILVDVKA